ncbi:MAG: hypothetical protein ACOCW6_04630 [Spirochaetota bacterium]
MPLPAQSGTPTLLPDGRTPAVYVDFGFSYLYPLGRFSDTAPPAPGPTVEARLLLKSLPRLEAGLLVGYVPVEGREPEIDDGSLAPVLGTLRFTLLEDSWFLLSAVGGIGGVHTSLDLDQDGIDAFQFASSLGLEYRLTLGRLFVASAGWSFLFIFEDAGPLGSLLFPLQAGIGL